MKTSLSRKSANHLVNQRGDDGDIDISVNSGWIGWVYDMFLFLFNDIVKHSVRSGCQSDSSSASWSWSWSPSSRFECCA